MPLQGSKKDSLKKLFLLLFSEDLSRSLAIYFRVRPLWTLRKREIAQSKGKSGVNFLNVNRLQYELNHCSSIDIKSNLAATARMGSGVAILHRKAYKTCLVGGIGACPDPLPSGILLVSMTSWVSSSQVSLVMIIRKWLLSSSGKYSSIVLWTRTLDLNFFAHN